MSPSGFRPGLAALLEESGIPGISVSLRGPGESVVCEAVGVLDRGTGEPVKVAHRSFSGSIGKMFTSAVTLQLLEERGIALDANVSDFLSHVSWFAEAQEILSGVSFRMLLQHTSGLEDYVYSKRFALSLMARRFLGWGPLPHRTDELIRMGLEVSRGSMTRGTHNYVDTGYLILGVLIEHIAEETYYDRLQRLFLDPLELRSIESNNKSRLPGTLTGHLKRFNRFLLPTRLSFAKGRARLRPGSEWTGGGLIGSADDFAKWIWWLVADKGLGPSLSREMTKSVETKHEDNRYGLGMQIEATPLGMSYGHFGWYPGFRSMARYYEEQDVAVGILVNKDAGVNIRELADRIVGLR